MSKYNSHRLPLISVVVPVYNVEKYLSECVKSICDQTYTKLEIILVDDGSTDNSGYICDKFGLMDSRVTVVHKVNEGLVSARKKGAQIAKGELIGNIDGDDWIEPDMLQKLVDKYLQDEADIVQCGFFVEDDKGGMIKFNTFQDDLNNKKRSQYIKQWLLGPEKPFSSQVFTKLIKIELFRSCYDKVPNEMNNGEDFISFLYFMSKAGRISSIEGVYYHYRIRNDSLSHMNKGIELLIKEDNLTRYCVLLIKKLNYDIPQGVIEQWVLARKLSYLRATLSQYNFHIPMYYYRNIDVLKNKKIIIYGAGNVGRDYIMQLSEYENINIVAWVDANPDKYNYPFRKVHNIDVINEIEFDYIVVAVLNCKVVEEICAELERRGVPRRCILWNSDNSIIDE